MKKTEYQTEIVAKIRKIRLEKKCSQQVLAEHLGISKGQMGNIESSRHAHKYTLKQIRTLCKFFNIHIKDIFLKDEDYEENVDTIEILIDKIIEYEN